ncbi:MAG: FecR domain-containing protein [Verrucomicrobiota bacterium]
MVNTPARRTLADGSVVELARGAEIAVEFSDGLRRVVLRRGEAHFAVAHDTSRPFIVVAGRIEVRAVGTAFLVGHVDKHIDVLVTEGRVAVLKPTATSAAAPIASGGALAMLDAGHQALFTDDPVEAAKPEIIAVSATQQAARLAWRVPRLEFAATPLREVVAMFNRHGATHLALDPALDDLRLSGVLRADDVDSLLLVLKNEFGIASTAGSRSEITLRRP